MIELEIENSWAYLRGITQSEYRFLYDLLSYPIAGAYFSKLPESKKYVRLLESTGNGDFRFPTGLLYLVEQYFKDSKYEYTKNDFRVKPISKKKFAFESNYRPHELRYYQKEAVEACLKNDRGVIEAATGTGKTSIIINLIKQLSLKTLVIVPSKGIKKQFHEELEKAFGKRMVGTIGDGKDDYGKEIIIANYHALKNVPQSYFESLKVVCIDEHHHCAAATLVNLNKNQLKNVFHRFGFTATFQRTGDDELELYGILSDVIFKYTAKQAIIDGFICPPLFCLLDYIHEDVPEVPGLKEGAKKNGRIKMDAEYDFCIINNPKYTQKIADVATKMVNKGHSTIVFVEEIEHGNQIAQLINGAVVVNGEKPSKESKEAIDLFNKGKIKCLVGTSILGEGIDTVKASCGIIASGGKAEIETMQRVGRVLRISKEKEYAIIIDFIHKNTKYLLRHSSARKNIYKKNYGTEIISNPKNLL